MTARATDSNIAGMMEGSVIFLVTSFILPVSPLAGLVFFVGGALAIGAGIYMGRSDINVGGKKRNAPIRHAIIRWTTPALVKDCGCVYWKNSENGAPMDEVVETDPFWLRRREGAKVEYVTAESQVVRCVNCGNHHTNIEVTGDSIHRGEKRRAWKEEEPDIRPMDAERPVKREEEVKI